jgi:hypothetical protein
VDQFRIAAPIDLGAQPADMRFHNIGARVEVEIPHALQQHRARDHLFGVTQQIFQKLKFARLQIDGIAVAGDRAPEQIHLQIGDFQNGKLVADMRAPRQGVHARVQLRKSVRLDKVVIAAGFESLDAVIDAAHRRQEQNRREDFRATQGFDER